MSYRYPHNLIHIYVNTFPLCQQLWFCDNYNVYNNKKYNDSRGWWMRVCVKKLHCNHCLNIFDNAMIVAAVTGDLQLSIALVVNVCKGIGYFWAFSVCWEFWLSVAVIVVAFVISIFCRFCICFCYGSLLVFLLFHFSYCACFSCVLLLLLYILLSLLTHTVPSFCFCQWTPLDNNVLSTSKRWSLHLSHFWPTNENKKATKTITKISECRHFQCCNDFCWHFYIFIF